MSQTLQSVLCITTDIYLGRVLVVLLHACFSVVSPIPFLLAAIFFPGHPYIGSTTVLPDKKICKMFLFTSLYSFSAPYARAHKLNEREDPSMIAHAHDEAHGAFYFSLTSFIVGTI